MNRFRVATAVLIVLAGCYGALDSGKKGSILAQEPSAQQPSGTVKPSRDLVGAGSQNPTNASPADAATAGSQEQPMRSEVSEKQKKLIADTDKLLTLATELKQKVDKTNKDVLSVEVVKKADEIEKLARSLKNQMK